MEYSLDLARKNGLLKNDRTIVLTTEETLIKITLILGRLQKEAYGVEDLQVSDVLDVFAKVKLARLHDDDPCSDGLAGKAADEYLKDLKGQNLVDCWSLCQLLKRYSPQLDEEAVLVIGPGIGADKKLGEIDLCKILFSSPHHVLPELPLDASFSQTDAHRDFSVLESSWIEVQTKHERPKRSKDETYTLQLLLGYFRLLVNSRDEMALARVVAGPGGILNHEAFNAIRKQSLGTVNMPIYQTLVSFVQRSRLGGKFESSEHPLAPFKKELTEFCDVMDKAHAFIEDQKDLTAFSQKLLQCFKSHIIRSSASGKQRWKMRHLDSTLDTVSRSFQLLAPLGKTPEKSVGNGGSVGGRANFKSVRKVVDQISCSPTLNFKVDLHKMLGKVEDAANRSEFERSLNESLGLTPSASYPSVITLFRSPEVDAAEEVEDDASLSKRLGAPESLKKRSGRKKAKKDKGRPKYESTLAWAPETSPIVVAESPATPATEPKVDQENGASPKLKERPIIASDIELEKDDDERKTRFLIDKVNYVFNFHPFPSLM